jgi:hypothetical protein
VQPNKLRSGVEKNFSTLGFFFADWMPAFSGMTTKEMKIKFYTRTNNEKTI